MRKHNNLFFLCENCNHPIILSEVMEVGVLPRAVAIQCHYCEHENNDLEELKQFAKWSREYTGG